MYQSFAGAYDQLMRDVPYERWAAHYFRLLQKYGAQDKKCVECACGSGSLTIPLKKCGVSITGVDQSAEMLSLAMRKARDAGMIIPFVRQDMCLLKTPTRVGSVLSTCDGVNYLLTKARVMAFLRAAYQALKPGGSLLFDVSTPYKLLSILGGGTRTLVTEDYAYIWDNKASAKTGLVKMALSIFIRDETGEYRRIEERQTQRAHSRADLTAYLSEAGFERIRFFGGMSMSAPKERDERWHIAALKPKL